MSIYTPNGSAKSRFGDAAGSRDELTPLKNAWDSQKHSLSRLHAEWFHNVLFVHGWQDSNIDMGSVRAFTMSERGRGNRKFNLTHRIVLQQKAIYAQIPHTFECRPLTADEFDIEGAEVGTDLLSWGKVAHKIQRVESRNLEFMLKMSNSVMFASWDPNGGKIIRDPQTGQPRATGMPRLLADNPVRWIWDPRATHYSEALWAIRRTEQSQEWLWSTFPEIAPQMNFSRRGQRGAGPEYWERHLQDWMTGSAPMPEGQSSFILFEYFEVPTIDNPEGRLIVAAGDSSGPYIVLHAGPNVYGRIPAVIFSQFDVPGSIWGECLVPHLKDPQIELNIRNRQISRNCDLISNAKIVTGPNGPADEEFTDEVAQILREDQQQGNPTRYLAAPNLPAQVFEQRNHSIEIMNAISAPGGTDYLTRMEQVRSAIQHAQIEEREKLMLSPQIADHVQRWEDVWTYWLDNMRRFAGDDYECAWLGAQNIPKKRVFSSWMLSNDSTVKFTSDNPLPESKMATFAKIQEYALSGIIKVADPYMEQKALEAAGLGGFIRIQRDATVHLRKARENITRVRLGEPPIAPDTMDHIDTHLQVYSDFMADAEFREIERSKPHVALAIRMMDGAFRTVKMAQLEAQMIAMNSLAAQGGTKPGATGEKFGGKESQAAAGRSAPQGAKQTQGFGDSPNPGENQGGPTN